MNVHLTPELRELVDAKVEAGFYSSASEVIREALRLMEERDRLVAEKLASLRREIAIGLEQADRGEGVPFDNGVLEGIKRRGRERLAAAQRD